MNGTVHHSRDRNGSFEPQFVAMPKRLRRGNYLIIVVHADQSVGVFLDRWMGREWFYGYNTDGAQITRVARVKLPKGITP